MSTSATGDSQKQSGLIRHAVAMKTADIVWQEDRSPAGGKRSAAVAFADGMMYFRYENGIVALVAADTTEFKLAGSFTETERSGQPSWAHPTLANGRMYLRDQDKLKAYKLK